jgi:hypothetical protein
MANFITVNIGFSDEQIINVDKIIRVEKTDIEINNHKVKSLIYVENGQFQDMINAAEDIQSMLIDEKLQ